MTMTSDFASPQLTAIMLHDVHRVSQDKICPARYNTTGLLTVQGFKKALDAITKEYTVISMSDFFKNSGSPNCLPPLTPGTKSYCLLTFDDGSLDHSEHVLPILEERGLGGKAAFFITGLPLIERRLPVYVKLQMILAKVRQDKITPRSSMSKEVGRSEVVGRIIRRIMEDEEIMGKFKFSGKQEGVNDPGPGSGRANGSVQPLDQNSTSGDVTVKTHEQVINDLWLQFSSSSLPREKNTWSSFDCFLTLFVRKLMLDSFANADEKSGLQRWTSEASNANSESGPKYTDLELSLG